MFNISEFKARVDRHGGFSRSSLFEINLSPTNRQGEVIVPGIISTDDLRFFCQTVSMPGINLEVMSYKPSGLGFSEFMPMNASPDQLNAVFMLDSNNRVMTFFHRWISSVINISGNRGGNARGLAPKLIEYKDTYAASELTIKHYSTHNPFQFYECRYEGVYPTQVSSIDLNWGADGSPTTMTVNFSYNRLIYSGFRDGSFETSDAFVGRQASVIRGSATTQTIQDFNTRNIDEFNAQFS
jgi:hypothetical protein